MTWTIPRVRTEEQSVFANPGDESPALRTGSTARGRLLGRPWKGGLPLLVLAVDGVAVLLATFVSAQLRFGGPRRTTLPGTDVIDCSVISLALSAAWVLALTIQGSRDIRILGVGSEEYKRVLQGTLYLFGTVAILAYAAGLEVARGYVGLALPLGVLLLLLGRFLVRGWVARQRHRGRFRRRLLLVGGPKAVRHIFQTLDSEAGAGYAPVAAALPGYRTRREDYLPIPVSTDLDTVEDVVALVDVAGPRLHTQPLAGLPLIHLSTPRLSEGKALAKRAFDVVASGRVWA